MRFSSILAIALFAAGLAGTPAAAQPFSMPVAQSAGLCTAALRAHARAAAFNTDDPDWTAKCDTLARDRGIAAGFD